MTKAKAARFTVALLGLAVAAATAKTISSSFLQNNSRGPANPGNATQRNTWPRLPNSEWDLFADTAGPDATRLLLARIAGDEISSLNFDQLTAHSTLHSRFEVSSLGSIDTAKQENELSAKLSAQGTLGEGSSANGLLYPSFAGISGYAATAGAGIGNGVAASQGPAGRKIAAAGSAPPSGVPDSIGAALIIPDKGATLLLLALALMVLALLRKALCCQPE